MFSLLITESYLDCENSWIISSVALKGACLWLCLKSPPRSLIHYSLYNKHAIVSKCHCHFVSSLAGVRSRTMVIFMPWILLFHSSILNFWWHYIVYKFHNQNSDTMKWQRVNIVNYNVNSDFGHSQSMKTTQIMSIRVALAWVWRLRIFNRGHLGVLCLKDAVFQKTLLSCIVGNVRSRVRFWLKVKISRPLLLSLWSLSF